MVRSCQAEESVSAYFDSVLKQRLQAQVGLLVGKHSVGSRDLLLDVIPSPQLEDGSDAIICSTSGAPALKAASSSKKPLSASKAATISGTFSLEQEWIVEHAMQVCRMLAGGVSLLGLYVYCPEASYTSGFTQACATLASLSEAMAPQQVSASKSTIPSDFLLLHIDSITKKMSMKAAPKMSAGTPSAFKPCELKLGPSISSLVCIKCRYPVQLSLPALDSSRKLQDYVEGVVMCESARVNDALATLEGSIPNDDLALCDALSSIPKFSPEGSVHVVHLQMLRPLQAPGLFDSRGGKSCSVRGCSSISGAVEALVYAHKRESVGRAVAEVKADICSSLQNRVDLLVEDALSMETEKAQEGEVDGEASGPSHTLLQDTSSAKSVSVALPSRVQMPWKAGLFMCDYLMPGEELAEVVDRAKSLLALEVGEPSFKVEALESAAVVAKKLSPWHPHAVPGRAAGTASHLRSGSDTNNAVACTPTMLLGCLAGAGVAAIAVLLGAMYSS